MRKALVLAALAGLLVAGVAHAAPVEVTVFPGYNVVAPPCVPFDPTPETVFMDSVGSPINIDYRLIRFDTSIQGYVYYDAVFPETFGKILLGDGLLLNMDTLGEGQSVTWKYDGVYDGVPSDLTDETTRAATMTDMWISLPKAGSTLIGCPFNHPVNIENVKITDGTQTVDLFTARDVLGWTDATFWYFNAAIQGYEDAGPDIFNTHTTLDPGHGYVVNTAKDNLALIIPAN